MSDDKRLRLDKTTDLTFTTTNGTKYHVHATLLLVYIPVLHEIFKSTRFQSNSVLEIDDTTVVNDFIALLYDDWNPTTPLRVTNLVVFLDKYQGDLLLTRLEAYITRYMTRLSMQSTLSSPDIIIQSIDNMSCYLDCAYRDKDDLKIYVAAVDLQDGLQKFKTLYEWSNIFFENQVYDKLVYSLGFNGLFKLLTINDDTEYPNLWMDDLRASIYELSGSGAEVEVYITEHLDALDEINPILCKEASTFLKGWDDEYRLSGYLNNRKLSTRRTGKFNGQGGSGTTWFRDKPQITPRSQNYRMHHSTQYTVLNTIATGTFGTVEKIMDLDKQLYARKRQKSILTYKRETETLSRVHHTNIVKLIETYETGKLLFMILEFIPNNLRSVINSQDISPARRTLFIQQLIAGLHVCHSHEIMHLDIKPENILVDASDVIKYCDFGLSRPVYNQEPTNEIVCSLWYRPPEVLLGEYIFDFSVDIWSLGCIFVELERKQPLIRGTGPFDQLLCIFMQFGTPTNDEYLSQLPNWSTLFPHWPRSQVQSNIDCVEKMLVLNPKKRCLIKELITSVTT
jgi:hypothetical protein